ncbi:hypothetical protein [Salinilacihabitans rarus]|uniref:hypothetical protein n=1 Tax=Salinilacihabitans rarus TaxID=2961596 RepID=UPI0020C8FF0B|nr:hypothetical protein [Salinilacihabitans rarus]
MGEDGYRGLPGALWFAFRHSDSLLFRLYALVGAALAALIALLFALGLIVVIDATADASATLAFSRSFVLLVGVALLVPILAPILLVARRHRRGADDARYDRRLALAGFWFCGWLYVGLVATVPPEHREAAGGPLGPVVARLYELPPTVGLAVVCAAAASIYAVHRLSR